ncbi:hypothetical protein RR46_01124 [Papilio xuthus]|uniref:Uncharacterized protein n=1 Tax=Papilio xuthus TaxID=66420 RepID=A0A0N1I5Q1_PAPXU|nr:hypothetical protein RR46_01124 [Papilio xuthus]
MSHESLNRYCADTCEDGNCEDNCTCKDKGCDDCTSKGQLNKPVVLESAVAYDRHVVAVSDNGRSTRSSAALTVLSLVEPVSGPVVLLQLQEQEASHLQVWQHWLLLPYA